MKLTQCAIKHITPMFNIDDDRFAKALVELTYVNEDFNAEEGAEVFVKVAYDDSDTVEQIQERVFQRAVQVLRLLTDKCSGPTSLAEFRDLAEKPEPVVFGDPS